MGISRLKGLAAYGAGAGREHEADVLVIGGGPPSHLPSGS